MLRQIKSCCDVFCMPRGLGIYRQHDDDKKKKKKHRTPEEEWLSGCVTIPGSGNSNMTIFEVTYSTEGTCDIPLKCREQIIHCFRSTSIDNSKSIPVQNTIDQNGTVEVDLHSEPIDLELSWYMPPSKNIHVGIGHLFSYAPLSETGCKDLRECQTERDFIPIDGLDFLEVTEMVNSTLRRRAYQEEGIQLASARGKITIYFNGWTYHLQGYDAYVILWGKKVEPYRKKILTHLPVIMGLRNDQLHYNTPTSSPPKRKKYKEEEEEEEEMKQATPPCRTGTDMDLVCLREDVPQVHEWLSCPKLGSVKVFDAPQQSATFWDVLMKEMVVKYFVQVDNYESGTIHYTQSDGEELGNNEAFFQNNQDFLNSLYSTTETAGYGKRYIHEHLGASPWVTVILSSFVFLIMFVLCIWYIFWVMKWRRMRRQPIHFKKE